MRDAFERDGYAVVEGALGRSELHALRAAVDCVWRRKRPAGGDLHELGFLGEDASFVELTFHDATMPLVCDVLGTNIFVYHCHLDIHPPVAEPPAPQWRWHQDGGRQNVDLAPPRPRLSVKVAYFLTDVTTEAHGPMWIVPGSHGTDRLATTGHAQPPAGAEPLLVRAGTAVVFDRRLWHARGDNTSRHTRKALFYGYTYRWIRARDDLPGIDDDVLARVDPVRRQLLGGGNSRFGYWFPEDEGVPLRALMR